MNISSSNSKLASSLSIGSSLLPWTLSWSAIFYIFQGELNAFFWNLIGCAFFRREKVELVRTRFFAAVRVLLGFCSPRRTRLVKNAHAQRRKKSIRAKKIASGKQALAKRTRGGEKGTKKRREARKKGAKREKKARSAKKRREARRKGARRKKRREKKARGAKKRREARKKGARREKKARGARRED